MTAIKRYAKIKNNQLNIQIPKDFDYEEVEVIILPKIENELDIEIVNENDSDYEILLKAREDRKKNPQNYIALDEINWD